MKLAANKFIIFVLIILLFSLASTDDQKQYSELDSVQSLHLQKIQIVQILPGVTKILQVNWIQLSKYITPQNEAKIMNSFFLQYQSFVRIGEIYVSVFSNKTKNSNEKAEVFDLNKDQLTQESTIFSLDFLNKFNFHDIHRIQIDIRSSKFAIISLALISNQISYEVDLGELQKEVISLEKIPVWMPFSYNHEKEKYQQVTKYIYFKGGQASTKLRIHRIKGHPKIFLYNCEASKMNFCREEINQEHIDGSYMFQKQLQISLKNEPNCKDCTIMLAIKNMGAETKMEIQQHTHHDKLVISKDNPVFYNLKGKQSLEITSYFILPSKIDKSQLFLDVSIIEGNSSSVFIEDIAGELLFNKDSSGNELSKLQFKDFIIKNQTKALRIILNPNLQTSRLASSNDFRNETWYKVTVKFFAKSHVYFTVIDRNIPVDQQNFVSLKDGQIFHSYAFSENEPSSTEQQNLRDMPEQNFKIKVSSISTLTISSLCSEINRMTVQFYPKNNKQDAEGQKVTKISPRVFVENITHHNKKCSQLIHLNPTQLFDGQNEERSKVQKNDGKVYLTEDEKDGWVYFNLSGVKTQVDLLYSSSDIIVLEKDFPYHSQLQYNQGLYFYVPNIKNQARIKIQKCSDCQISLSLSEEQLADLKSKRAHQIITNQVQSINNVYYYQVKHSFGLFIKVRTNNFAHFAIVVQEIQPNKVQEKSLANQISQTERKINFSLEQNNKLLLEFLPPTFFFTNNLNSPTHFSLIEGSINVQVSRETYCPQFIFSQKQRTRDVSITPIVPQLEHDEQGNEKMTFAMELKHHDFFGIRAQKGNQIFSYRVANVELLKEYAQYRWSIFNVLLFFTFALFMSFVCYMGLKRKKIKKVGGQVVLQSQDGEQTSMIQIN